MKPLNTKLKTAVEAYFADLVRVHASGGATAGVELWAALIMVCREQTYRIRNIDKEPLSDKS